MSTQGWFPDPHGDPTIVRYYDGTQWTGHTQPAAAPQPAPGFGPQAPAPQAPTPKGKLWLYILIPVVGVLTLILIGVMVVASRPAATVSLPPVATPSSKITAATKPATAGTVAAGGPAAPAGPCPAVQLPDGRVTNGTIKVTPPGGFPIVGAPVWSPTCGFNMVAPAPGDTWRAVFAVGAVGNPTGNIVDVKEAVWKSVIGRYFSTAKKVDVTEGTPHLVDGLPSVSRSGKVTGSTGGSDTVLMYLTQMANGDVSVTVGTWATNDPEAGKAITDTLDAATR